jgi:hypothetical protein
VEHDNKSITRNVTLDSQADVNRLLESCRARCLYTKAFPGLGVTKFEQLQEGETYYFDAPLVTAMSVAQAIQNHTGNIGILDLKAAQEKQQKKKKFLDFFDWSIN